MSDHEEIEDELLNIDTDEEVESQGDEDTSEATSSVEDLEEVAARKVAKQLGWVPPEEWTGKGEPKSASDFLVGTVKQVSDLKEKNRRLTQVQEAFVEDIRQKTLAETEAAVRRAARDGDEDAAAIALQRAQQQNPHVVSIKARNPWVDDPAMFAVADAAVTRAMRSGNLSAHATLEEQVEYGEKEVRRRFPEYFDDQEVQEVKTTRNAPVVQSNTRSSTTVVKKDKGWDDLPVSTRRELSTFVDLMAKKVSKKEAQDTVAKEFWKDFK